MGSVRLREVVPHGGSTVPSTDVIQFSLTLQMITARQPISMQQSYLVLRQPSDDHAHPTYRSTKESRREKRKTPQVFTPSYGLELEPSRARGLGAIPIIYFLKTRKLKITATFSVFWW